MGNVISNVSHPQFDLGSGVRGGIAASPTSGDWQLAAGHFEPEVYSMVAVAPRPDAETGAYAGTVPDRHRWAYYDGSNPTRYEYAPKVFGGSAPHIFTLTTAPVGATVGNDFGNHANHGVIKWIPTQAYATGSPATFVLNITGQDGNSIDLTWTVATSSTKFIFISNAGNDSTGDGTIGSPYATLTKMMGAASTDVTFPDKIVYMRGGNFATVAHSDSWNGGNASEVTPARISLKLVRHPYGYLSYPDEAVTIDFSGGQISFESPAFCLMGSSTQPLTISGSSTNAAETHNLWGDPNATRCVLSWVTFDGFIARIDGNYTNSCPIFTPHSNTNPTRQYWALHNVLEINRNSQTSSLNDFLTFCIFGIKYWVDDYCGGERVGQGGALFKDTGYNTSSRYARWVTGGDNRWGFNFASQTASADQEMCFSFVGGPLILNGQTAGNAGKVATYRNTVHTTDNNYSPSGFAGIISNGFGTGAGPHLSTGNAISSKGPNATNDPIINTKAECQATNASGDVPFDLATGNLVNVSGGTQYRDLYLGTRGWEIA